MNETATSNLNKTEKNEMSTFSKRIIASNILNTFHFTFIDSSPTKFKTREPQDKNKGTTRQKIRLNYAF